MTAGLVLHINTFFYSNKLDDHWLREWKRSVGVHRVQTKQRSAG